MSTPRYVAFLRGVSPTNAKMADLKLAFEGAGFTDVRTVLSSGNVVFTAPRTPERDLGRQAEQAMTQRMGRAFPTIVRAVDALRALVESDPFAAADLPADGKRVVTFLQEPLHAEVSLPIEADGVHIFATNGAEVFTVYVRNPRGPVFMTMLEKAFGTSATTRTWETVKRCAAL